MTFADHPHTDPGDGRTECDACGKYVWPILHSCKRVPVTAKAQARARARSAQVELIVARQSAAIELDELADELERGAGEAP